MINIEFSGIFQKGLQGAEVKQLQQVLAILGFNLKPTAVFDEDTIAAVKDFQEKHNLAPDGTVGRQTQHAINSHSTYTIRLSGKIPLFITRNQQILRIISYIDTIK